MIFLSCWIRSALLGIPMIAASPIVFADPLISHKALAVDHITISSAKSFAELESALDKALPQLDMAIVEALKDGDQKKAKNLEHGADLFMFLKRDLGSLTKAKTLQYEIGNPITAAAMTQYRSDAALYAPLRIVLYENNAGGSTFEYDKPSTLFGQFGDERVTKVGHELDAEIEKVLLDAAR